MGSSGLVLFLRYLPSNDHLLLLPSGFAFFRGVPVRVA